MFEQLTDPTLIDRMWESEKENNEEQHPKRNDKNHRHRRLSKWNHLLCSWRSLRK